MKSEKHIILIGGLSNLQGPLPTITNAIINSPLLQEHFIFIPYYTERTKGLSNAAQFNLTNIIFFIRHYISWIYMVVKYRPHIVHYPVTSFWNFPKSMFFLISAKFFKCKTIGHLHGGAFETFWNKLYKPFQFIGKKVLNLSDGMIVLGEKWKKALSNIGCFEHKIFILPNPIDENFANHVFQPPFQNNKTNLLFIGRISKLKGVDTILRALGKVVTHQKNFHIKLVGPEARPGDFRAMRKLASEFISDKYYEFTGPIYGKEKIKRFSESDIFVFPSNRENFPLVIIEAMSASRPIICTPVGAVPEYLKHGVSCLFVNFEDADDLGKKIEWMISHPNEAIEMGRRAKKVFEEKLIQEKVMKQLKKIYFSVLEAD
ncbi:glycosyltransferase family 4 protein [Desulfonema magnum]|uniref:Glycosyltransferase domain-containing protein n=1 Tax=Desulfonema magnum TaxID=45655 RepID=A0A975BQI9_9BACT|nr:glycosyltransferase family 4 protein [Desulfonema magnum]QTA90019.1 Glycosyltransferase domain-containing protein [Desulfonema magnum]